MNKNNKKQPTHAAKHQTVKSAQLQQQQHDGVQQQKNSTEQSPLAKRTRSKLQQQQQNVDKTTKMPQVAKHKKNVLKSAENTTATATTTNAPKKRKKRLAAAAGAVSKPPAKKKKSQQSATMQENKSDSDSDYNFNEALTDQDAVLTNEVFDTSSSSIDTSDVTTESEQQFTSDDYCALQDFIQECADVQQLSEDDDDDDAQEDNTFEVNNNATQVDFKNYIQPEVVLRNLLEGFSSASMETNANSSSGTEETDTDWQLPAHRVNASRSHVQITEVETIVNNTAMSSNDETCPQLVTCDDIDDDDANDSEFSVVEPKYDLLMNDCMLIEESTSNIAPVIVNTTSTRYYAEVSTTQVVYNGQLPNANNFNDEQAAEAVQYESMLQTEPQNVEILTTEVNETENGNDTDVNETANGNDTDVNETANGNDTTVVVAANAQKSEHSSAIDVDVNDEEDDADAVEINETSLTLSLTQNAFYYSRQTNVVLMHVKTPLSIYGTVKFELLLGAVELYGYEPKLFENLELFSPRGCSSIIISNKRNNESTQAILQRVLRSMQDNYDAKSLQEILQNFNLHTDALLLFECNIERKSLVGLFRKSMNENVFPNMSTIHATDSESMLDCTFNSVNADDGLIVPKQWSTLRLQQHSKVLLAGGQKVGKSTLLRYLINQHVKHYETGMLVIDLDVGQTELFVPETISCFVLKQPLLGPGFFYALQPEKAYLVRDVNVSTQMPNYVLAMKQLLAHCHEQYAHLPWLINTMGYNKGQMAMQLMSLIINLVKPTDVLQLQSNKPVNNFDKVLTVDNMLLQPDNYYNANSNKLLLQYCNTQLNYKYHQWNSAVKQEGRYEKKWAMGPKDLRHANFLSRLNTCLTINADALIHVQPLNVALNKFSLLLNDSLLVQTTEQFIKLASNNVTYFCRTYPTQSFEKIECIGIGIIRSLDFSSDEISLIPAMSPTLMPHVNTLCVSNVPLPTALLQNQPLKTEQGAHYVFDSASSNASKSIKQIYHRNEKFLHGPRPNLN